MKSEIVLILLEPFECTDSAQRSTTNGPTETDSLQKTTKGLLRTFLTEGNEDNEGVAPLLISQEGHKGRKDRSSTLV
jgi:hypothetical protein